MNIKIKSDWSGKYLNLITDNVKIEEDIMKRHYKKVDGKMKFDYDDVDDIWIHKIQSVLSDMIYYRSKDYDSTPLVKELISKMPSDKIFEISEWISKTF